MPNPETAIDGAYRPMTVRDLIASLQAMPPDMEVAIVDETMSGFWSRFLRVAIEDNTVLIDGE